MRDREHVELFDLFWENSKLNPTLMPSFSRRIATFASSGAAMRPLEYPGADHVLPMPDDGLIQLMRSRRSQRDFADTRLSDRQIGSLFAAFGGSSHGTRLHPSAGGLSSIDVYGLMLNVDGALADRVAYYNADNHSLSIVPETEPASAIAGLVWQDDLVGSPSILFVFVLRDRALLAKYGERGGRFGLIEAGHAIQNLALRLTHERLAGIELGGYDDDRLTVALGLDPALSRIALVVACGVPEISPAEHSGLIDNAIGLLSRRPRRWRRRPDARFA
jgi:SagB-type dehydrogenase family enzyme